MTTAKTRALRLVVAAILAAAPGLAAHGGELPRVAVVIDDLGYRLTEGLRAARLPGPVAVAILPHTGHSALLARVADQAGKEILLHLPMQPIEQDEHPGPGELDLAQTHTQFDAVLADDLASVPLARGVNNHMGSLLTRHPEHMRWVMEALRAHGSLFFLDSFTTADSVGLTIAREEGVPALRRDVFLDTDQAPSAIEAQWERLLVHARSHGFAVGIGHPYPATLDLLEEMLPKMSAEGFVLVPPTSLLGTEDETP